MNNGPKVWNQLLAGSPEGSVIMGGAVVDYMASNYLLGNTQPKDFDIFHTYHPGKPDVNPIWEYVPMNYNDEVQADIHKLDYGDDNKIGSVYNYEVVVPSIFGGHEIVRVQMIGVHYEDPKEHLQNFDHSLTLGSYSENGLFVHQKVFESFMNKEVTYIRKEPDETHKSYLRAWQKITRYDPNGLNDWVFKGF